MPPVSDEELHGFVDGEIEGERRAAIADFLASSPVDAARVESWRRQNEIIRAAFARVEGEPALSFASLPPPAAKNILASRLLSGGEEQSQNDAARTKIWASAVVKFWRDRRQARWLIGAFAGGMIAATLGAWIFFDRSHLPTAGALDTAAPAADDIFVQRTQSALLAFAPQKPANAAGIAPLSRQPSQAALVVPNLSAAGLTLVGVRVAPGPAGGMFCFFYAKNDDSPVGLCAERDEGSGAPGFHAAGRASSSSPASSAAIVWRQNNAKYALAGALPEAELRNLAARINAEVEAFDKR